MLLIDYAIIILFFSILSILHFNNKVKKKRIRRHDGMISNVRFHAKK